MHISVFNHMSMLLLQRPPYMLKHMPMMWMTSAQQHIQSHMDANVEVFSLHALTHVGVDGGMRTPSCPIRYGY